MSRKHRPGRRTRRKRQPPEVIVLAPRQPLQDAPAPDDEAREVPAPERKRDRRREVVADMQEEARRWR